MSKSEDGVLKQPVDENTDDGSADEAKREDTCSSLVDQFQQLFTDVVKQNSTVGFGAGKKSPSEKTEAEPPAIVFKSIMDQVRVATPTGGVTVEAKDTPPPPKDAPIQPKDAPIPPKDGLPPVAVVGDNKVAPKDAPVKPAEIVERAQLSDLRHSQMSQMALIRMLPDINALITKENALAKAGDPAAVDRPLVDTKKLKEEWAKGIFGPESRTLWREAQNHLEKQCLGLMVQIDSRGLAFPPGAPIGPRMSDSGSGFREGDGRFRTRLRNDEIKLAFGFKNLTPGELPQPADVERLLNATIWTGRANHQLVGAFIEGQANAVEASLEANKELFPPGRSNGWKRPEGLNQQQTERWSSATTEWLGTANRVRFYCEAIASLNNATTTRGMDFPSLAKAYELAFGIDNSTKVFPADGLEGNDFLKVVRDGSGTITSIELDLPNGVERTEENLAKMAKLDAWLQKNSPKVDQVFAELTKLADKADSILLYAEVGDIHTTKKMTGDDLRDLRKANPNLKGDAGDVDKRVVLPNGDKDYAIKTVNKDGSYVLEARSPDGKPFNLKRYGFDVINCDKDGNDSATGEYRKVVAYQDYLWARDYAYNNWNVLGSVKSMQRVHTRQPEDKSNIFLPEAFVPINDNGRTRLMQVKNINAWASASEWGKQTGNVANLLIDVGMFATGVGEARAAWKMAAAGGEIALKEFAKQGLKAFWHIGLGASGFGKQFILNEMPYGHEIMTARHAAIIFDLSLQLLPQASQKALWAKLWGETKEGAGISEQWMASVAKASEAGKASWFDKALIGTHKVYEGKNLTSWLKVGVFPCCDYYFLAQFSDVLRTVLPGEQDQRERLFAANFRYGMRKNETAERGTLEAQPPIEAMRKMTSALLSEYTGLLAPDKPGATTNSEDFAKVVQEAKVLPHTDAKRQAVQDKLGLVYRDDKSGPADKLAAARGILELAVGPDGKPLDKIKVGAGEITVASIELYVRTHPTVIAEKVKVLSALPDDAERRVNLKNQLADLYLNSRDSNIRLSAAQGLLQLGTSKDTGKISDIVGEARAGGRPVKVLSKDLQEFVSLSSEGLLNRAKGAVFLEANDPKRLALGREALAAYRRGSRTEDRIAAAIVLLSLRGSDSLTEKLGDPITGCSTGELWKLLKNQASNGTPEIRLASGDFLLRTSRSATANLSGQSRILAPLEEQLQKTPNDEKLKEQVQQARERVAATNAFDQLMKFDHHELGRICMDVLSDPKASRATRMAAMVSTSGPRLGLILEQMKHQIEPALEGESDQTKKFKALASMYGRDSYAMQSVLRSVATNPQEDADVRAIATRLLRAADSTRTTVNGVPLTPGVEMKIGVGNPIRLEGAGLGADHARIRLTADGQIMIRDMGSTTGTTIIRAGGKEEKLGKEWSLLGSDDRVVVGDKEKRQELVFGMESLQQVMLAAVDATSNLPSGAISTSNQQQLLKDLKANTSPQPGSGVLFTDLIEGRARKLNAAESALELGSGGMAQDPMEHAKLIASALADCIDKNDPITAKRALEKLTPALIGSLDISRAEPLRDKFLMMLADAKGGDPSMEALRQLLLSRATDLFAAASKEQRSRLVNICESVLLPSAEAEARKSDKNFNYPVYGNATPELRAKAIAALEAFDPDRALVAAKLLLLGGDDRGQKFEKDVPSVRLAAIKVVASIAPPDLQSIALNTMRSESDPRVLPEAAKVEYGSRRPDLDPVRLMKEVDALRERLDARAKPGFLEDGKAKFEEAKKKFQPYNVDAELIIEGRAFNGDIFAPEAKRARAALLYVASGAIGDNMMDRIRAGKAADQLERIILGYAKRSKEDITKLAQELAGPLEYLMLNNLKMEAEYRQWLVKSYAHLRPGDDGVVSKEEAAAVYAGVLQNELKRMPRNPYGDQSAYQESKKLQEFLLEQLKVLPSEAVIPVLDSLSRGEGIQSYDSKGRPASGLYGNTVRKFEFDDKDVLWKVTQKTPPLTLDRVAEFSTEFKCSDGTSVHNARVILENRPSDPGEIFQFDSKIVRGEKGDFRYEKDHISYVHKPNGTVITEDLGRSNRTVKITYPDGKSSREFVFTHSGVAGKVNVTVTSQPGGKSESWIGENRFKSWADKDRTIHSIHSVSWQKPGTAEVCPFQFDKGEYVFANWEPRKLFVADVNGAEYNVDMDGKVTGIRRSSLPQDAHPYPEIRQQALLLLHQIKDSTSLPKQAAEAELRYIDSQQQKDPQFVGKFGSRASTDSIATEMGNALCDATTDARTVVATLYKGMLSKPIEANDPRLVVLRAAVNDGNDLVRVTAAKLLSGSSGPADQEKALFAAADISKNSAVAGVKNEATSFLDQQKSSNGKGVDRALLETVSKPRHPGDQPRMDFDYAPRRDLRYQRAFERVKSLLAEGQQEYSRWSSWDWERYCGKSGKYNLLSSSSFHQAGNSEVAQFEANRGSMSKWFDGKETVTAEQEQARKRAIPKMWHQFDDLVQCAMTKADLNEDGQAARRALVYLVSSNAQGMPFAAEATNKAIDAMERMCKGKSPGRGDFEGPLVSLLTENGKRVDCSKKERLVDMLVALGGPDGKVSNETIASTATLALEQEFRFMPRMGQPGYDESVKYQRKLLDTVKQFGNAELAPALDYYAKNHVTSEVRQHASEVKAEIEKRTDGSTQRIVDVMIADTKGARKFSSIVEKTDARIPLLLAAMNNTKLPEAQRVRAADILMEARHKAVSEEQRQAAGRMYADLGLRSSDAKDKFEVASGLIDHTKSQFTADHRAQAANVLGVLALSDDKTIAAHAAAAVAKLSGAEGTESLSGMLSALDDAKKTRKVVDKQQVATALESLVQVYEGSERTPGNQALLLRSITHAEETLGADHELTKRLLQVFKIDSAEKKIGAPSSETDARFAPLMKVLDCHDVDAKLAASQLLLQCAGLTPPGKTAANVAVMLAATNGSESSVKTATSLVSAWDAPTSVAATQSLVAKLLETKTPSESLRKCIALLPQLYANSKGDPAVEAAVFRVLPLSVDASLKEKLYELIDRSSDQKHTAISGETDPRIASMKLSLTREDGRTALYAALALGDKDARGVDNPTVVLARRLVNREMDVLVAAARQLEQRGDVKREDKDAAWKRIDRVLEGIGEKPEDYSRTYATMKRMELVGDQQAKLLPLYERLEKLSKDGGSDQAAAIYAQKAEALRGSLSATPALAKLNDDFLAAKALGAEALPSKDPGKIADAELKLKAVADGYKVAAGPNSQKRAEVLTELGAFYAAQGKHREAVAAAKDAVTIYDARRDIANTYRTRSLGTIVTSTYGEPGSADDFKEAKTKLVASTSDSEGKVVSLEDAEVLKQVVDYMVSRGAIREDAAADVRLMSERALAVTKRVHGEGSQQAAEALEKLASTHIATGQPMMAMPLLQQAKNQFALPGLEGEYGRVCGKIAEVQSKTGNQVEAQKLYEEGIEKMTAPGANVDPKQVSAVMDNYRQLLTNTGQVRKAQRIQMAAMHYKQFGIMPPLNAFGGD